MHNRISKIQTSDVNVPRANGKDKMTSFLAYPEGNGPFPGLLVIHEIFGLNDNIREIARRFAGEGYAALAIDLFSNRNRAICILQAFYGMMFRPLDNPLLADLQSSLDYLGQLPEVDSAHLGAVGFCMGGGYALQLAVTDKGMKAASVFYGANPKPLDAVARSCPIVGSYPDKDFTTDAARKLDAALTRHEVPHDIKIYDNTLHSFFNRQRTGFEVEASKDAWQRMLSFFEKQLIA
jgi:carboxymethylenebutenolidase